MRIKSIRSAVAVLAALASGGCETYSPLPLDEHPRLAAGVGALRAEMPKNWGAAGTVDTAKPLDAASVALLAVENNPDLVAARTGRSVAQAQVIQAGLLPNPQITSTYGFLRAGPGTADSWSAGLSEDLRALITLSARRTGAELGAAQVEADILWQEWQVIGKARLFYVDTIEGDRIRNLLDAAHGLLADRMARDRRAIEEGNLTFPAIAPDLTALADIDKQIADADRQALTRRRDFNLLLGLDPSVELRLAATVEVPELDAVGVERILPDLARRRPDLIALRLGYGAQEEKMRGAILAQFPALVLGGLGARDNSAVYSIGPSITMDLPLFNRNQGNIAIERATRGKLYQEYATRVATANAEIRGILVDQALLRRQLTTARNSAAEAEDASHAADTAYDTGLIDTRSYVDLVTAALNRRREVVAIEQSLLQQQVALATLAGAGMPTAEPLPEMPDPENRLKVTER